MEHLGVELHGPYRLRSAGKSSIGYICRRTNHLEIRGDSSDGITMAHPYLRVLFKTFKEGVRRVHRLEISTAILTAVGLLNLSSKGMRDELCAIADSQYRDTTHKLLEINLERLRVVNRVRRATQDDSNHTRVVLRELVVGQNLAEGIQFTDTTTYQLRGLRTEIQNNNLLCHTYYIN